MAFYDYITSKAQAVVKSFPQQAQEVLKRTEQTFQNLESKLGLTNVDRQVGSAIRKYNPLSLSMEVVSKLAPPPSEERVSQITSDTSGAPRNELVGFRRQALAPSSGTEVTDKQVAARQVALEDKNAMILGAVMPVESVGERGLTTKLLSKLEGRTTVSRQFIQDLSNQPELRQAERDLIRNVLKDQPPTVNVKDFANKVKTELLPLTRQDVGKMSRYESIALPEDLRGPVANYGEHIYESPIKTSAGDVHFSGAGMAKENYFAHTRIEDLPPGGTQAGFPRVGNAAKSKEIAARTGDTRRVIEIQSDLFQKGRLEGEMNVPTFKNRGKVAEYQGKKGEIIGSVNEDGVNKVFIQFADNTDSGWVDVKKVKLSTQEIKRQAELSKLEPYRNTWHERIIREEVKQAAIDGKTKLQFPTGETAMKIEGLGQTDNWYTGSYTRTASRDTQALKPESLKVGMEVNNSSDDWIITDVLGDGKFKAVPKDIVAPRNMAIAPPELLKLQEEINAGNFKNFPESEKETFDISGKVDTNNPIYKFYEKEVGKFLKNNFNAKMITDPQGVTWWQLDVVKDAAKKVFAFGGTTAQALAFGGVAAGIAAAPIAYNKLITQSSDKPVQANIMTPPEAMGLQPQQSPNSSPEQPPQPPQATEEPKDINQHIENYVKKIDVTIDSSGQLKQQGNTLAIENNNPGNLRFAGQPNATKGRGGFAKFPSPEVGFRALIKQVQADQGRGLTLAAFIQKYAPPAENDFRRYINFIKNKLSASENTKINSLDPIELAKAVAQFESQTKVAEL